MSSAHNYGVRISLVRRVASLLIALAFIASAQLHAAPMPMVNADIGMAGMAKGSPSDTCKGCGQSTAAKVDCTTMCAPVFAVILPAPVAQPVAQDMAWMWMRDAERSRATTPDTAPPRS